MRLSAPLVVVVLVLLIPATGSAQDRTIVPAAHLTPSTTSGIARPAPLDAGGAAAPPVVTRLSEEIGSRLRAIEQRFQDDQRLQRAAAVAGLGAAALGALQGKQALTFAGTHVLRLGFDQQLTRIRQRSGFSVEPSIGYRTLALRLSRTFD